MRANYRYSIWLVVVQTVPAQATALLVRPELPLGIVVLAARTSAPEPQKELDSTSMELQPMMDLMTVSTA